MSSKAVTLAVLSILIGLFSACGGAGGGSSEAGVEAAFYAVFRQSDQAGQGEGNKTVTTAEGTIVVLEKAYLTLWSVELADDCRDNDYVFRLYPGAAYAHAEESPTVMGTTRVINLTGEDNQTIALGTITPPSGSYCGVNAQIIKADSDAVALPSDVNMVNRVVYLKGTYQTISMAQPEAFEFATGRALPSVKRSFDLPVELGSGHMNADVTLNVEYGGWFDGLDFANIGETAEQDRLLTAIAQSVRLER